MKTSRTSPLCLKWSHNYSIVFPPMVRRGPFVVRTLALSLLSLLFLTLCHPLFLSLHSISPSNEKFNANKLMGWLICNCNKDLPCVREECFSCNRILLECDQYKIHSLFSYYVSCAILVTLLCCECVRVRECRRCLTA